MFQLHGIFKKEEIKEFTRKDGTPGSNRIIFIEPIGNVYPIKVNLTDMDLKIGKVGDKITLDVAVFPYSIVDKKRKRAFLDVYIPTKK